MTELETHHQRRPINGFDTALQIAPQPSLRSIDWESYIYEAQVQPLTSKQVEKLLYSLSIAKKGERVHAIQGIRNRNAEILDRRKQVVIVLDGRAPLQVDGTQPTEGYIGDMLEASRLCTALQKQGIAVTIATPHPELFRGFDHRMILPIPGDFIPASPAYPWNQKLLSNIATLTNGLPIIFPLNAQTPVLIETEIDGTFTEETIEALYFFRENFVKSTNVVRAALEGDNTEQNEPTTIKTARYSREGIHQLQAFQAFQALLGLDYDTFHEPFLRPSQDHIEYAAEVARKHGCFDKEPTKPDSIPIYFHIGVHMTPHKMRAKYYPPEKWQEVIMGLKESSNNVRSLVFLRPTNDIQAADTVQIAQFAESMGYRVHVIPIDRNFSLGVFYGFLQELQYHNGLVVGCDSMPVGHATAITGNHAVVLGSNWYPQHFYCPAKNGLVVMPDAANSETRHIEPKNILKAIKRKLTQLLSH